MKRGDIIIIGIVIVLVGLFWGFNTWRSQVGEGDQVIVEVRINGHVADRFPLDEDLEKEYETAYGHNHLLIKDNVATISDADCPDQICVETKDATKPGDAIVCVPNRFTVELIGEGGDIDVLSQ